MVAPCREEQGVPLGLDQGRPAGGRVPLVHIEQATQRTGTDRVCPVQRFFRLQVEKEAQRSLQAALLIRTGGNREQRVCQNGRALPAKLEVIHTLFLASGSAFSLPLQVQVLRNPYDNAKMESFYKTLKNEEVDLQEYVDLDDARRHIDFFIADLYNHRRLHSSLG